MKSEEMPQRDVQEVAERRTGADLSNECGGGKWFAVAGGG